MPGTSGFRLPFQFDPQRLQADLAGIAGDEWSPHYNDGDFGGEWRGVALRSASGGARDLIAVSEKTFVDTSLLDRCPYFREVLAAFQCPLKSVRLLSLAAGSFIREHSDHALEYEDGEIRIHIPILTSEGVEFYVSGERLSLEAGGCYYINVNRPHRVNNRGATDRVHLVIDALVNGWVDELFERCGEEQRHIPRCPLPARSFDDFRKVVLEDAAMQEALRGITDRGRLIEEVVSLGRGAGFDFHEADVEAGFRTVGSPCAHSTSGWTPIRVSFEDGQPCAEMVWTGGRRFTEPFFADSVRACLQNPFAALFRRAQRYGDPAASPGLQPSGFIFHMSRCGSTLISQMLGALPRTVVIAEAEPLDQVIQAENVEWLRWIVGALGQSSSGIETHYFIKLDSWHIHKLPLIRAAFPDTPWIFVYRDPREVLASQLRQPGLQAVPGALDPRILGLKPEDAGLSPRSWCIEVLAGYCRAALSYRNEPCGMFVNYRELPGAVLGPVARHFGLSFNEDEEEVLREAARRDAKNPYRMFERDEERLKDTASVVVLEELYREFH